MNPRYNSIDNTSPFQQALENDKPKISYTAFPFGRSHVGNMNIGTLEILDCFDTIPNGRYDLNLDLLIKTRAPLERRIFNGCRVYIDAWYNSWSDLWEAAENHVDHGRSGLLDIDKPFFTGIINDTSHNPKFDFFTPNSVANQLGIPVRSMVNYFGESAETADYKKDPLFAYMPTDISSGNSGKFVTIQDYVLKANALPFAMFQRLAIDKYYPKNLIQGNKNALPDNKEKQKIAYSITEINCLDSNGGAVLESNSSNLTNPNSGIYTLEKTSLLSAKVLLGCKRYSQRKGDYFSTSSIFPDLIRGQIPEEELAIADLNIDFTDSIFLPDEANGSEVGTLKLGIPSGSNKFKLYIPSDQQEPSYTKNAHLKEALNAAKINGDIHATITANTFRRLMVQTLIKERSARTNGDYISYVEAMYGKKPQAHDISAKHIGSFYQDIVFSDVTQTSASTSSSPLGKQAGQAMCAGNGNLGSYTAGDYGIIMIVAHIVPDDFYSQGVPRWLAELGSDSVYLPLQNNLPPMAIKRREIFLTNSESTNNDVWAYTEFGEDEKARDNFASGFPSLPKEKSLEDGYFIMHSRFESMPEMNPNFVLLTPDNVDMDIFSVTNEPPFIFNAISNITKYEARPYNTLPMDFGAKY